MADERVNDLLKLIQEFNKQYAQDNARITAHFSVNRVVPRDQLYVAHIPKIHEAGAFIGEPPSIDATKDYSVLIHPDTLDFIRAEFNKISPMVLTDTEMAYMIAVGALGDKLNGGKS